MKPLEICIEFIYLLFIKMLDLSTIVRLRNHVAFMSLLLERQQNSV